VNEKTREELIRRSVSLHALSKHPSFKELVAEVERRKERDLKRMVADIITTGDPVDQRTVDYTRGWWDSLSWALGVADKAETTLGNALEEAEKAERRKNASKQIQAV